jgi:hypothetical protein
MDNGTFRLFVSVISCAALVVPTACAANVRLPGDALVVGVTVTVTVV